jgi:hypothetical protein
MRTVTAALACLVFALALCSGAGATTYGVADDTGKYADDGGKVFFSRLNDVGMTENRVAVLWDATHPSTIVDQAFLDRSIPQARLHGIEIVFAIYPARARALADTPNGVELFAEFAAKVAARYPTVAKIVCLNEGNQPRFHQPQFDAGGNAVAGALQERAMAACYDALKSVNPNIDVLAFGISPRGNDDFNASSNISRSPILFVKDIGDAYRASGRTRPIADDVAFHCHPNLNTDAPSVGFAWPNAGCANLDRFKQAWWDAFHGTGQPLFEETGAAHPEPGTKAYVRFFVDEAGYQARVPADKTQLYAGSENVKLLDDTTQGNYYAQLIAMVACDRNVKLLNLFHLADETLLPGWQSGLEYVDGTPRASYAIVKAALAANRTCHGPEHLWHHTTSVVGASVRFDRSHASFVVAVGEGFTYKVSVLRGGRVVTSAAGTDADAGQLQFKLPRLTTGAYRVVVRLKAQMNRERVSAFARTLQIASAVRYNGRR